MIGYSIIMCTAYPSIFTYNKLSHITYYVNVSASANCPKGQVKCILQLCLNSLLTNMCFDNPEYCSHID